MKNEKLITTIITTYKRSDSLEIAIESVLNQTYENIELIVVDDNNNNSTSRMHTNNMMKKYKNDSRVIYIQHEYNMNGANARNTGLKEAHGQYITFLDDDDSFSNERFETLIPILENKPEDYGAVFSSFQIYKENKKYRTMEVSFSDDVVGDLLADNINIGSGSNFIIKKEVVEKIGGFDPTFLRHQDYEFLVRVADSYKFATSKIPLLNIEVASEHQNKISIDKLISTKKQYLEKYENLMNTRDKIKIINSQYQRLIYLIFVKNEQKKYQNIINDYKKNNSVIKSFIILNKLRFISKVKPPLKKLVLNFIT